jgi:beta-fructofuranosidase
MEDLHRPLYHYRPARNWMNDPNGLIHWRGQYHLFYQYNPHGPLHGQIHWGHAVSADLAHWRELPVALVPTPGGPDAAGCWSGCAVDHDGVPTFIYTGVHPQTVCLATGSDDLLQWTKHPANPVIAGPPAALAAASQGDFRDPYVWREGGRWQMVIGSKAAGRGGLVLRYHSDDLVQWAYGGPLLQGDSQPGERFAPGAMWECPNFFPLGDGHVLILSAQSAQGELLYPVYYAGAFDGERLAPRRHDILVHGSIFYAPQVLRLADGRTLMWGWLKEGRPEREALTTGWAGVLSLPIALSALPDGRVGVAPVEELKVLRREHWHYDGRALAEAGGPLAGVRGDALEIVAELSLDEVAVVGLDLLCTPDGRPQARVLYDAALGRLSVEPGPTFASTVATPERYSAPLPPTGRLRLHVFVDRSVVEVFANDATCLAARVYPAAADGLGVGVSLSAGSARLTALDVWTLAP